MFGLSLTSLMFFVRMFASLCMHEPRPEAPTAPAAAPPERDECQRMLAMLPAAAQPKKALKPTQKSYTLRRPGRSSIGILLKQKSLYVTNVQTIPRDEHGTPLISQKGTIRVTCSCHSGLTLRTTQCSGTLRNCWQGGDAQAAPHFL